MRKITPNELDQLLKMAHEHSSGPYCARLMDDGLWRPSFCPRKKLKRWGTSYSLAVSMCRELNAA